MNKISFQNKKVNRECTRCGRLEHSEKTRDCPAKNAKCRRCNLQGHFAFCCKTNLRRRTETNRTKGNNKRFKTEVNFIDNTDVDSKENKGNFECFNIDYIGSMTKSPRQNPPGHILPGQNLLGQNLLGQNLFDINYLLHIISSDKISLVQNNLVCVDAVSNDLE